MGSGNQTGGSEEGELRTGRGLRKRRRLREGRGSERREGLEGEGLGGDGLRNGEGLRDGPAWKGVELREIRGLCIAQGTLLNII